MNGRGFARDHASMEGKAGSALSDALASISAAARLGLSVPHGRGPGVRGESVQLESRESVSPLSPEEAAASSNKSRWASAAAAGRASAQRHPGHGSRPSWSVSRISGTTDTKSGVMRYSSSLPSSPAGWTVTVAMAAVGSPV